MSDTPSHSAYCPNCVKNVPHFRRVRNRSIFNSIDSVIGPLLSKLRIGPWYCLHCERRTIIRRSTRMEAIDYRIIDPTAPLESPEDSVWVRRQWDDDGETRIEHPDTVVLDSTEQDDELQDKEIKEDLPIGNFIVDQKSLVVRSQRLLRYSEKYRDSVIEKILSGDITIREARSDKDISEAEIISWIADRMQRLEAEVAQIQNNEFIPSLQVISDEVALESTRRKSR